MKCFLILLSLFSFTNAKTCWGFADLEYEGRIDKSEKVQITCPGNYCLTLSEQGSDFNVYNGTCPDSSVAITDCESRGVGCQNEKLRDVYVKVCCCNYDLCNSANSFAIFSIIFVIFSWNFV